MSLEAIGRVDCLFGVGLARAHLGRVSAALEPLLEALDIARRADLSEMTLRIHAVLGWLYGELRPACAVPRRRPRPV